LKYNLSFIANSMGNEEGNRGTDIKWPTWAVAILELKKWGGHCGAKKK